MKFNTERMMHQHFNSENEKDPRECPRKFYNKSFFFSCQEQKYKGYVANISRGGAFIKIEDHVSLGKKIELTIPANGIREDVKLKGWVVRLGRKGIGVKFDRRSGFERRCDLDRRIGIDRRARGRNRNQPSNRLVRHLGYKY